MVNIMTREEMLKRLKQGEDPWNIIFDKWKRIKKRCQKNEEIDPSIFGDTCVLCEVHTVEQNASVCCHGHEYGLLPCPLVQIGERCSSNNTWGEFANNPSPETSQKMIDLLKTAMNFNGEDYESIFG